MKRYLLIMFLVLGLTLSAQEFPFEREFWEAVTLAEVQALIDEGANVKARNEDGDIPLMLASWLNENPEVVKVLLAAVTKVDARDKWGYSPLTHAAKYNKEPRGHKGLTSCRGRGHRRDMGGGKRAKGRARRSALLGYSQPTL